MKLALHRAARLARDRKGLALIEFAYTLPLLVTLSLVGAELTSYIVTKMRVSQLALHIADNAARMGAGSLLASKRITEGDINDVFVGAQMQSGPLDLNANGRVILSDLEPTAPNAATYRIKWQRCYGTKPFTSSYGAQGDTNLPGIGPAGRRVTARGTAPTMFVEVRYLYKPLMQVLWSADYPINEIASMSVRDRRDLTQIYTSTGVTASTC